jgi:tryptophanyl-tRNA synthetase
MLGNGVQYMYMKQRQVVLSGIRATGRLHLGNFLGAVKGMLELQDKPGFETLYMVADVHTMTTPYDTKELRENRREVFLDYLAAGLDPTKCTLFIQSMVPEHLELAFYFASVTSIARMLHLPTYKDKVKQYPHSVTMALLNYPVLMAADILIYKAHLVPVGLDQEPHLEVAREIARKMNAEYDMDFPEPQRFATSGEYVPSLTGEGKMSKSVAGSYIAITDNVHEVAGRLAKTPTDGGRGEKIPQAGGVAHLLQLVELFEGAQRRKHYETLYTTTGIRYQELKSELTSAIYEVLKPLHAKREQLLEQPEYIDAVIADGAARARLQAQKTIQDVREKMGLG